MLLVLYIHLSTLLFLHFVLRAHVRCKRCILFYITLHYITTLTQVWFPEAARDLFSQSPVGFSADSLTVFAQPTSAVVGITVFCAHHWKSQFSSFQDVIYALRKPICAPPRLSEVSPTLPLKRFQCSSDWRWPSRPFQEDLSRNIAFPHLFPPGDRWCDVLGFVPAGSVSSFSTLQIFREASHLWGLLCPPVYLLGHIPNTGNRTTVWTQENTAHSGKAG